MKADIYIIWFSIYTINLMKILENDIVEPMKVYPVKFPFYPNEKWSLKKFALNFCIAAFHYFQATFYKTTALFILRSDDFSRYRILAWKP